MKTVGPLFLAAFLAASCAPPSSPSLSPGLPPETNPTPGPTSVYLVGMTPSGQAWWKDGVKTALPANCQTAYAIATDGTHVYVGGVTTSFGPAVWKNGVKQDLPMTVGHTSGVVKALALVDGVLYAAGFDQVNAAEFAPRLWKDGVAQPLTFAAFGQVNSLFVRGTDVSLGGFQLPTLDSWGVATVWKNGSPTALTDATSDELAYGVFADTHHVYAAGAVGLSPVVWVDTVVKPQAVADASYRGTVRSIWVQDGTVYAVGNYRDTAKLWTNGVMTDLTTTVDPASPEEALAVVARGTDVYILGRDASQGWGYWKNGTFQAVSGASLLNGMALP